MIDEDDDDDQTMTSRATSKWYIAVASETMNAHVTLSQFSRIEKRVGACPRSMASIICLLLRELGHLRSRMDMEAGQSASIVVDKAWSMHVV